MNQSLNFTRILASLGMVVFLGAIVAAGTGAFFSDTETSEGNVFTAGAIDLQIDNSSYGFDWNDPTVTAPTGVWQENTNNSWELTDLEDELFFNFTDLKPGDYGEDTISLHVDNNDAYACMAFNLTSTLENGQNEPEAAVDPTAAANAGELQNYLSFLFWMDDGDNILEDDEVIIDDLSGLSSETFTGDWLAIAEGGDEPLPAETTEYLGKGWCFGDIAASPELQDGVNTGAPTSDTTGFTCTGADGDHNDAQTDGIEVDVSFYAVQSRNNDDFSCAALPSTRDDTVPTLEEITPAVGPVALDVDEDFVLMVDAADAGDNLFELEVDHNVPTLPEFTVYASETNPYGSPEAEAEFASFGATVAYDAVEQKWTIDFGPIATAEIVSEGGITFFLEITDEVGNQFGDMFNVTPGNTFEYSPVTQATP